MPNKTRMMPTKLDRFQITGIQFNTNVPKECHLEIIAKAGGKISTAFAKSFFAIPKELHILAFGLTHAKKSLPNQLDYLRVTGLNCAL